MDAIAFLCSSDTIGVRMLTVAPIFSDHAVLQRGKPLPVWGKADPGTDITLALAGQTKSARADAQGKWRAVFDPITPGGPHTLTAASASETITAGDILIGDVWLASGQSNMQFSVDACAERDEALAAADNYPAIRMNRGNGWRVSSRANVPSFSAVGFFFAMKLADSISVPIGIIDRSAGGTRIEAWMSRSSLSISPNGRAILSLAETDEVKQAAAADEEDIRRWTTDTTQPIPAARLNRWRLGRALPTTLYERYIMPMISYALAGVIWYQGESNASAMEDAFNYRGLLPALIGNWRGAWDERTLPFIFTQLPNYKGDEPNAWAVIRESMLKALSLSATAMAVSIDLGETADIHPKRKMAVGHRLALAALGTAYGQTVLHRGPRYASHKVNGSEIRINFEHAGEGLSAKDKDAVKGFQIASADKNFKPAKAAAYGSSVVVKSFFVARPYAVRYAWENDPVCDLTDSSGLPASPFRTDEW